MEIKCPKCRYRFEVRCAPGVRELTCVCPRCGTPFSHELPEEESAVPAADVTDGKKADYKRCVTPLQAACNEAKDGLQQEGHSSAATTEARPTQFQGSQQPRPVNLRPDADTVQKKGGPFGFGFKSILFALLLFFALVLFGPHACHSEESYTSRDVSDYMPMGEIEELAVDSFDTSVTKEDAKLTPKWVFGTWKVTTEYGTIEVRIADQWLRETSDGGTSHATFYYTPGQLNCSFPDDGRQVKTYYRLDENKHLIDAGEGMWMTKISDR